jgi:hypothetical protein
MKVWSSESDHGSLSNGLVNQIGCRFFIVFVLKGDEPLDESHPASGKPDFDLAPKPRFGCLVP